MEMNKVELGAVQAIDSNVSEAVKELAECELLLVGGGCGDISLG